MPHRECPDLHGPSTCDAGSTITFLVASVDERIEGDEVPAFTVCDEASGAFSKRDDRMYTNCEAS